MALLHEHGATLTLLEECRDGNVAAIATLLDGGADVEAKGDGWWRPTEGDEVLIVDGEGKGSLATIAKGLSDEGDHDEQFFQLKGASCATGRHDWYEKAQVTLMTALAAAAVGGHLEAVRLLLERGAKADGESGAATLHAAKGDEVTALLREHGATLTLPEECRDGNVAAIMALLDGGADIEAKGDGGVRLREDYAAVCERVQVRRPRPPPSVRAQVRPQVIKYDVQDVDRRASPVRQEEEHGGGATASHQFTACTSSASSPR